ncbi:phage regulatory protein/antirepressor Ant [Mycobacterium sp. CnD-18-1]|uniref:phage regulatory protein/antirepressor Ant n=1 Tax=Mycobacterium sp. CnD-18-1 TaxID=2917744 RepID=UPI001EF217D6|nr:phage regulatory protein/antirepressor Ant [Mycobacterium sp. CnD-18-1]MCG7610385.1 phage regulatory protein/antirepressor Ant [Mycobacterium sp. CnD-18-1]
MSAGIPDPGGISGTFTALERTAPIVQVAEGVPTTTSMRVANGTQNEHASVMRLIRDNLDDFEEFALVRFEIRPRPAGQHGGGDIQIAILNEEHATLLLTYMRNSAIVRDFKKRLVREFWELRRAPVDGNSITRMELIEIARNAEMERLALEAENRELAPKAEAFDTFLDATGKFGVGAVAKMLGKSQNWLFRELRNRGVFIAKGSMRNTPYQQYMHHFEVKAHEYERSNGEIGCSYTTYVQPSGIDFIRRKLDLPTIDPLPMGGAQ